MNSIDKTRVDRWIKGFLLAAEIPLLSRVKLIGEDEIDKADPGDITIGTLESYPLSGFPGNAGVCLKGEYTYYGTCISGAAVNYSEYIKLGTHAINGEQRYIPWVAGTDDPGLIEGIATTNAASADTEFYALLK